MYIEEELTQEEKLTHLVTPIDKKRFSPHRSIFTTSPPNENLLHTITPTSSSPSCFSRNENFDLTPRFCCYSYSSPPHKPMKMVRFCEAENRYTSAASNDIMDSPSDIEKVWYGYDDMDRFLTEFSNVAINMEKGHRHRARVWLHTLRVTYQDSLDTDSRTLQDTKTRLTRTEKERLRFIYAQEPELVGIEDMLIPQIRVDGLRRQRKLLKAIHKVCRSDRLDQAAKDYHIRVLSQQISQPSRIFANQIALAQLGTMQPAKPRRTPYTAAVSA